MGTDCDTEHYLVVAKVRERLAVSRHGGQKFDGERFNLKQLNELEIRKQSQVKISNGYVALENLSDSEDINRAWEDINENIKTSAKEILTRKIKQIVVNIETYYFCQLRKKFYPTSCCQG